MEWVGTILEILVAVLAVKKSISGLLILSTSFSRELNREIPLPLLRWVGLRTQTFFPWLREVVKVSRRWTYSSGLQFFVGSMLGVPELFEFLFAECSRALKCSEKVLSPLMPLVGSFSILKLNGITLKTLDISLLWIRQRVSRSPFLVEKMWWFLKWFEILL